jgi:hypothetical protein
LKNVGSVGRNPVVTKEYVAQVEAALRELSLKEREEGNVVEDSIVPDWVDTLTDEELHRLYLTAIQMFGPTILRSTFKVVIPVED